VRQKQWPKWALNGSLLSAKKNSRGQRPLRRQFPGCCKRQRLLRIFVPFESRAAECKNVKTTKKCRKCRTCIFWHHTYCIIVDTLNFKLSPTCKYIYARKNGFKCYIHIPMYSTLYSWSQLYIQLDSTLCICSWYLCLYSRAGLYSVQLDWTVQLKSTLYLDTFGLYFTYVPMYSWTQLYSRTLLYIRAY
jgi:hypothetical protein